MNYLFWYIFTRILANKYKSSELTLERMSKKGWKWTLFFFSLNKTKKDVFCLKIYIEEKLLYLEWKLTQPMLFFVLDLGLWHSIVFKSGLIFNFISFLSLNSIRIHRISFNLMNSFNSLSFRNLIHPLEWNETFSDRVYKTANILWTSLEKKDILMKKKKITWFFHHIRLSLAN